MMAKEIYHSPDWYEARVSEDYINPAVRHMLINDVHLHHHPKQVHLLKILVMLSNILLPDRYVKIFDRFMLEKFDRYVKINLYLPHILFLIT